MGRIFKFFLVIIFLIGLASCAKAVFADTGQPDAIHILSVNNYRHAIETNDLLIVAHFQVQYNTIPATNINSTYLFRVLDSSGVELGRSAPVIYIDPTTNLNLGYGEGIVSLYFPAATAPAWSAVLTYRLEGNPGLFSGTIPSISTTLETWNATANRVATGVELRADLLPILNQLEFDWAQFTDFTPLLLHSAGGTVLTTVGERYMQRAIPGIRQMAPTLFYASVGSAQPTPATHTNTYRNTLYNRLQGTIAGDGLDTLGTFFGTTGGIARTLVAVALFIVVFWWVASKTLDGRIGLLAGAGAITLTAGFGIPPLNALAVMALLAVGLVGYVFFYARA